MTTHDEHVRAVERAARAGCEASARELLLLTVRTGTCADLVPGHPPVVVAGRAALGPLMAHEVDRARDLFPDDLLQEGSTGYLLERARAAYGAILHVRLLELERIAEMAPDRPCTWQGLHTALDVGGEQALAALVRVVRDGPHFAALRAARVIAARETQAFGLRLAALALEGPAEARGRIYRALAGGTCPLEGARAFLQEALAKEKPELREAAFLAFKRCAREKDLLVLRREGPPDLRAQAFLALLERRKDRPVELVLEALADPAAELRRAAVKVLSERRWEKDPRAQSWLMGRLLDPDRVVRIGAMRTLRRRDLPPRVAPRLRTIASAAPPSLRPPIFRLAERVEG